MLPPSGIRRGTVKHQYVGDINDYRKYALRVALSAGGANRIGACWMLMLALTILVLPWGVVG